MLTARLLGGRSLSLVSRLFRVGVAVIAAAAACTVLGVPAVGEAQPCGVKLLAPEITSAISSQNADLQEAYGWNWETDATYFDGNYNPCAPLSVVITSVEGATASSPDLALLFRNGRFMGPATEGLYPFVSLNEGGTTPDTVVLDYKDPQSCSACDGPTTSVRFGIRDAQVRALDALPPIR